MTIEHSQKDWIQKLPAVEYAIDLAQSDTTGYAPFFLNYGSIPSPLFTPNIDSRSPGVRSFMNKIQKSREYLKEI